MTSMAPPMIWVTAPLCGRTTSSFFRCFLAVTPCDADRNVRQARIKEAEYELNTVSVTVRTPSGDKVTLDMPRETTLEEFHAAVDAKFIQQKIDTGSGFKQIAYAKGLSMYRHYNPCCFAAGKHYVLIEESGATVTVVYNNQLQAELFYCEPCAPATEADGLLRFPNK